MKQHDSAYGSFLIALTDQLEDQRGRYLSFLSVLFSSLCLTQEQHKNFEVTRHRSLITSQLVTLLPHIERFPNCYGIYLAAIQKNKVSLFSKVIFYILILEEVTSVNISMCRSTRIQDLAGLTTPALLPQLPRAGGPPVFMAQLLTPFSYCLCNKGRKYNSATPALILFTNYCPITFTIFLFDIYHISDIMASSGKPSGPGHLANDPYLCDVCGRGFPTKEEYDTHRLQH